MISREHPDAAGTATHPAPENALPEQLSHPSAPTGHRGTPWRRTTAEALRRMSAFVALESLPMPTASIDPGGAIVLTNHAFRTMLGYSPDELGALTLGELVASHRADCPLAALYAYAGELVALTHKDGHLIWVRATRSVMQPPTDSCALMVFADHTDALRCNETIGHRHGIATRPRCCRH